MSSTKPGPGPYLQWTIVDGMILIVATGVGLVLLREVFKELDYGVMGMSDLRRFGLMAQPLMLCWAVGLLVVGLHRLREPSWRLMRRPGLLACLMAGAMTLISLSIRYAAAYVAERRGFPDPFGISHSTLVLVANSSLATGFAILFAWTTLLLTGAWRPSPDWIDRAGRLLGLLWIMLWLPLNVGL
jgi:hypothetical protein